VDILSPTWIPDLIQAYGLWVLFAVVMLESMGIAMPGETALVTAALYAGSTHQIGIVSVVLVAGRGRHDRRQHRLPDRSFDWDSLGRAIRQIRPAQ
jgi:hypothetical protein